MGTWHNPGLGWPIAAPLERCAQLLAVDLTSLRGAAAKLEPYLRADGSRSGASCSLSDYSRPGPTAGDGAATSTVDGA